MLGWIGNVFIVAGLWWVGNKQRWAFILSCIGESFWIANSYIRRDFALLSICVVFFLMAVRGWVKWGKS